MLRKPERMSSLEVDRGLYVLRYVGTPGGDAPVIFVRPSPGSEDDVKLVGAPGESPSKLVMPGSVTVVVVEAPATLQVTAQARAPGGSLQAEVRLEPLTQNQAAVPPAPQWRAAPAEPAPQAAPAAMEADGRDLTVLAHVARRGDVAPEDGAWVAGPDAPAPIEGLAIHCDSRWGALQYQVLMSGESRWADWVSSGSFAGSRGKARPLTAVRLRLIPAAGSNVSLEAEALFLGSAVVRKDGLEMEFRSAAGLDPLVGFRLGLKHSIPVPAMRPVSPSVSAGAATGRVRVFKASAGRRSG